MSARIRFDHVPSLVDDPSDSPTRIPPEGNGPTCAAFLPRAAGRFASHGIDLLEQVITDNHTSRRLSNDMRDAKTLLEARHLFVRSHFLWQNGKVERFNGALATDGPADRPS